MADPFKPESSDPLTQEKARDLADESYDSPFHTLGAGPTQAAPGNHKHGSYISADDIIGGTDIVIAIDNETGKITISYVPGANMAEHSDLTGLTDDDHPQYLTPARANAAYAAGGHTHPYAASGHTHPYAAAAHTHTFVQVGLRAGVRAIGSVPGDSTLGPFTVAHGLGKVPVAVVANATLDTGVQSVVISIASWDATNVVFLARNVGSSAEDCSISWIAVG